MDAVCLHVVLPRPVFPARLRRVLASLLLLATMGSSAAPGLPAAEPGARVATVNGDAITAREFVEALRRGRALYDDETKLRQAALVECVRFVVTLQLAREHGVAAATGDAELRNAFTTENARRAATLAKGRVVYGPRQLSWDQFRATWLDRVERELGYALLARKAPASSAKAVPHQELLACEAAVSAALARADVQPDAALLATLGANTPLPAPAGP